MAKKKTIQEIALLNEAAQLKIYGGTNSTADLDTNLTVYINKGCTPRWADCKKICSVTTNPL